MNKLLLFAFCLLVGMSLNSQNLNSSNSTVIGTSGTLTVSFTTADPGGMWDPENVLAVWVQDSSGKLVTTLLCYTSNTWESAKAMSEWWSIIGSRWSDDYSLLNLYSKMSPDGITGPTQVDGMSGPTINTSNAYGFRFCAWGVSENLNTVADGSYTVKMEIANQQVALNTPGHYVASIEFLKGVNESYVYPNDVNPSFKNIAITWIPDFTALKSPNLSKAYHVFPNPAKSFVFVDGFDIQNIELFSLTGKSVLKSKQQHLNLSSLPAATYIMLIKSGKGLVSKKLVKL